MTCLTMQYPVLSACYRGNIVGHDLRPVVVGRMTEVLSGVDPAIKFPAVGFLQLSPPCEVAVFFVDVSTLECYTL